MRAVVMRSFGGPEVLALEMVPTPSPAAGEVVIAVGAVSVNRTLDLVVREGHYARPVTLPHVLGADPCGTIAALGDDVSGFAIGDRVATSPMIRPAMAGEGPVLLGVQVWGGYAEYVRIPAANCHRLPAGLGFAEAAVVARHAPLAFGLLRDKARLQPGETVLVMGASGGLGSAGVQIGKLMGARVIAAAGADERVAAAVALGADHGINYKRRNIEEAARELTDGRGVDVLFENLGNPDLFERGVAAMARHGRIVTAGAHAGGKIVLDLSRFYLNQLTLMGSTQQSVEDVDRALAAAAAGDLKALIDRVLPLEQAAAAHRWVGGREGTGKVVLDPAMAA